MQPLAILHRDDFHHLDHLAPLAYTLNCPVLVDHEKTHRLGQTFYPQVSFIYKDVDLSALSTHYNTFFFSTKLAPMEVNEILQIIGTQQPVRCCYCPHGFSDKGYKNDQVLSLMEQDICLFYAQDQIDVFQKRKVLSSIQNPIVSGNFRRYFYEKYRSAQTQLVKEHVIQLFNKEQPIVLYAPSWSDQENDSSFLEHIEEMVQVLPKHLNLIVKLHPYLERCHTSIVLRIQEVYKGHPQVQIVSDMPLIYALLDHVSYYVGDYSSVGYDMLYTNAPLYFLVKEADTTLHQVGQRVATPTEFYAEIAKKTSCPFLIEREALKKQAFGVTFDREGLCTKLQQAYQ